MSEPEFYAEDLVLITSLAEAYVAIRRTTLALGATDRESDMAAFFSLIAALHKRCEAAEALVKELEDSDVERRVRELEEAVQKLQRRTGCF